MSGINLNIGAGYISAVYFVVLDLFVLTLFDLAFSRVVCLLYYHRIKAGFPISIRSADIPGVTTYLIGRYYSRVNLVVYFFKFLLLGCLLYIDLGITNTRITKTAMISRTGTFVFNASDSAWEGIQRSVERRRGYVRQCYTQKSEAAQFYHVAFDLSHGATVIDETASYNSSYSYELNDTTLNCLSPKFVPEKYATPIVSVLGCSQLQPTTCMNETVIRRSADLLKETSERKEMAMVQDGILLFDYETFHFKSDTLSKIFPAYAAASNRSEMTCTRTFIGKISKRNFKESFNCMLVVYNRSTTIFEQWEYKSQEEKLVRYLPGPVFNGTIEYGRTQRINQLRAVKGRSNWLRFSSSLIADSMVYQPRNQTFERYTVQTEGTNLSWGTVTLAVVLLVIGIIIRILVAFTIGRDDRPQLNTIDGLSSIAREEVEPSGRSYVAGDKVFLGWFHNDSSLIRFGPVRSAEQCIKRSSEKDVEII